MNKFLEKSATGEIRGFLARLSQVLLWPIALIYYLALIVAKNSNSFSFHKNTKLPQPVISVGNLTWGGTGKTPCVLYLIQMLRSRGLKPVVLTRGYMASHEHHLESDEGVMIKNKSSDVDVLVGKNRVQNALKYLETKATDLFILDDGFQHWPLQRDLDIVLINACNPFGNGLLIPAGMLREPITSLKRASIVVLTKTNLAKDSLQSLREKITQVNPLVPIVEAVHQADYVIDINTGQKRSCEILRGKAVVLCSSIADPESFSLLVTQQHALIKKHCVFDDHFNYEKQNIESVLKECIEMGVTAIVITEKDWAKLEKFKELLMNRIDVYILVLQFDIVRGKDVFVERINSVLFS